MNTSAKKIYDETVLKLKTSLNFSEFLFAVYAKILQKTFWFKKMFGKWIKICIPGLHNSVLIKIKYHVLFM